MNALALCARGSCKNVLSEVRDPRHGLIDSMDHVTGACLRPKRASLELVVFTSRVRGKRREAYDFRVP